MIFIRPIPIKTTFRFLIIIRMYDEVIQHINNPNNKNEKKMPNTKLNVK